MCDGTVRRGGIHLCDKRSIQPGFIGYRDREGIAQISCWPLLGNHRLWRQVEPTDELSDVTHVRVKLAPPISQHPTSVPRAARASGVRVGRTDSGSRSLDAVVG